MCGITGIFDTRGGREIDRGVLQRMNDSQHHRGPDEGSVHVEPGLGFGHRRLGLGWCLRTPDRCLDSDLWRWSAIGTLRPYRRLDGSGDDCLGRFAQHVLPLLQHLVF